MKRLILTNNSSAAGSIAVARVADFVIALERQLVREKSPSDVELAAFFGMRKKRRRRPHWLDYMPGWRLERYDLTGLGLIELCERYDKIDLWIDPYANDQLQLICLLHYLRPHREIASRLTLRQSDLRIGEHAPEELAKWRLPAVKVDNKHFELASRAWRAFGAPTPQDWFELSKQDLNVLPRLRQAVLELLEELPWRATGIGATEMQILEFIAEGGLRPGDIFARLLGDEGRTKRRVFGHWEIGELLDGLARCPKPAVHGVNEGPFTFEMYDDRERRKRYDQGQLWLAPLGWAILGRKDDISRHNPIHRWWGGTELTNDRLWRWDPEKQGLVAP
jgi:hypothetical protein